ncbi:hypothetical protein BH11MYX4_BH11MYX4_55860 [soil metagenome]
MLPNGEVAYVAVMSGEMPGSFRDIARHSWIVANLPQGALVATPPPPRRGNGPRRPPPRRSSSLRRYEWVGNAPSRTVHRGILPSRAILSGDTDAQLGAVSRPGLPPCR